MDSHYLVICSIIALIVIFQLYFYRKNQKNRNTFRKIFPVDVEKEVDLDLDNDFNIKGLTTTHKNRIWEVIIVSINKYLSNNKGAASDYHLIKDIVDRNCNSKEEEIQTQIPVPLYLGLVGTMAGILVGILYLWLSGGLHNLLTASGGGSGIGAKGVEALLGGVALAMVSSILGIILTTRGSLKVKDEKVRVEADKNTFLTWMQAELLPNLSNDTAQTLEKMTKNLASFNRTFSGNTRELKDTLSTVTNLYADLSNILTTINNMKIVDIASANIEVYNKLKNCTDEIGKLGEYLQGINQYQANTSDAIKEMHKFFASGNVQIDSINGKVREALKKFGKDTEKYLKNLQVKLDSQIGNVDEAVQQQQIDLITVLEKQKDELAEYFGAVSTQIEEVAQEQKERFEHKMQENSALVDALKSLPVIVSSMSKLVENIPVQSQQIENLAKEIEKLAKMKASGGVKFPLWAKIMALIVSGSVGLAGMIIIIREVINLLNP
jgi:ABC-type transporter Mla subunit MlaD